VIEDARRAGLLYELACAFAAQLELDALIPLVVTKCREVFEAEGAAVMLLATDGQQLYFPYVAEEDPAVAESLVRLRFPADRGIAGAVLASGRAVRIDDVSADPRFYPNIDRHTGLTTRSLLSAPLSSPHGTVGVLQVVNRRGGEAFDDRELTLLELLGSIVAVAIENAQRWDEMKAAAEQLRAQVGALRRDRAHREHFGEMVGSGPAMAEVFQLMESAAASPIPVVVEGETGTGKELVARGIHAASARGSEPFIAVNCAALPETLLESELFGYRRGAFTGATRDQPGLFEAASGGTIFLDEIAEMPTAMQAKLLRVLQEGEVTPVGDQRPRRVDVRVISATNRDLVEEVARRRFRDDLYYRLGAFPIRLPPLRERREDIAPLVDRFLAAAAERHRKRVAGVEPAALELLERFEWPGNVRELRNEIERAVALALDGEVVGARRLSAKVLATGARPVGGTGEPAAAGDEQRRTSSDLRDARTAFEVEFIGRILGEQGGNVSRAARALGISRVALQKKMKEYGLR